MYVTRLGRAYITGHLYRVPRGGVSVRRYTYIQHLQRAKKAVLGSIGWSGSNEYVRS